jgi:lipopolysaccharide export system permease protein
MTRYVLGQLLAVFFFSLGVLTLLILVIGLVKEAHDQGLGMVQIAQMIPFVLPMALTFSIPATALFTVSLVYGRMASANEVVALKSLGISPWSILWPMFCAATLLSLFCVLCNDLAAGWGREGLKRVVINSIEEIAYGHLRTERSFRTGRFSIAVKQVEGRRLIEPIVTFTADDELPSIVIRAEWAELHADTVEDTLTITLHNGSASGAGVQLNFPGTEQRVLPLADGQKRSRGWAPAEMPLGKIGGAIAQQKIRIEDLQEQLAARGAFDMLTGDMAALAPSAWQEADGQLRSYEHQLHRLEVEPSRRWASGFSCLCFVLVGGPLAIRLRNANFLTTFFLCFGPILLIYFPFLMITIGQAKIGALPPWTIWTGNLVLALSGLWILRHVLRF